MNWWNRFGSSLLFAVVVAGICPLYLGVAGPWIGHGTAFFAYVLLTAGLYLLGIARRPGEGLGAAFATLACGAVVLMGGGTGFELVLLVVPLLGVFRSGLLLRAKKPRANRFGRRFAVEFGFLAAGLVLARFFAQGSVHPEAFALWGFYLAQSGFFLLGGSAACTRERNAPPAAPDAFAAALKRAREVLSESERAAPQR